MKSLNMTPELYKYVLESNPEENHYLKELRQKTDKLKYARLRSPTEQMHFISFLLKLNKPKSILELGTFTGYSTLSMALATPNNTKIITCDINNIFPSIGHEFWQAAGVSDRIDLKLGHALDTLKHLEKQKNLFDFIYIDADKENVTSYFKSSLRILSESGIIIVDNVLWKGSVINGDINDLATKSLREFNISLKNYKNITYCLLPVGDGISLITNNCN